jgi:hypothetical protein
MTVLDANMAEGISVSVEPLMGKLGLGEVPAVEKRPLSRSVP